MAKRDWKTLEAAIGFFLYGLLILTAGYLLITRKEPEVFLSPILAISGFFAAICFYLCAKRTREFFKRT
ncbi:MAG: hypothetical protein AAB731_03625 [Patescibacteria group bacterium]